ncbi:hypothetical protein BH11MYX3_BH11MYX3_46910 [soil metagenome]
MSKLILTFRIINNGKLIREEKLGQTVIKIGKVASAHLHLDDESVSRMHAIIEVLGNDISLIDLGSTRGTFVNGTRIKKTKIKTGDVITVGDTQLELSVAPALVAAPVAPMPEVTQTLPPPVPMAAPRVFTPAPAAAPMYVANDADDAGGARAIEVATMLGDSVVNVKHCMDPKGGKVTSKTWGFVAAGIVCLATSVTAFSVSVSEAARNKGALDYWTHVQKRPAHAFRPATHGIGLDYLAFGGLAFGLLGVTAGLARARRERKSPFYRIGTAPGVEQALETAPSADFPMVAPQGDEFVFNFGAGMDGEMTVNGQSTPLAELAASGRARPSATTPGATEVPLPGNARIRVRSGLTTFLVSAVAQPKQHAVPLFAMEGRALKYVAGSLAAHLGLIAFLGTLPAEGAGVNIDLQANELTTTKTSNTDKEVIPPDQVDPDEGENGEKEGPGATMALPSGTAGKPTTDRVAGGTQVKNTNREPALTKEQILDQARNSGFLGSESALLEGVTSLSATQDFSSGFHDVNSYGPEFGADGNGRGTFGGGRTGDDIGGGCSLPPCGLIGAGKYGTIGNGTKAGDGYGGPGNGHGGMRTRTGHPPGDMIGRPILDGDLDKATIKRYIKRSVDKIAYCYEKQLLANPNMGGTINVAFYIDPNGNVKSSQGQGFDANVASCVSNVISQISFPKPKNGGGVQVNYPFNFRPSAQ